MEITSFLKIFGSPPFGDGCCCASTHRRIRVRRRRTSRWRARLGGQSRKFCMSRVLAKVSNGCLASFHTAPVQPGRQRVVCTRAMPARERHGWPGLPCELAGRALCFTHCSRTTLVGDLRSSEFVIRTQSMLCCHAHILRQHSPQYMKCIPCDASLRNASHVMPVLVGQVGP